MVILRLMRMFVDTEQLVARAPLKTLFAYAILPIIISLQKTKDLVY